MKVEIACPKCNGEKHTYEKIFTKCKDCITYMYSGLQPPSCSEGVTGCDETGKVVCRKCGGKGKVIVEGNKVSNEDGDTLSLPDIRNKLSPFKNLIAMIESGMAKGTIEKSPYILGEIEQCKISIAYLSGKWV